MRRLLQYLLPYKKRLIVVIFVSLVMSALTLMDAWVMGRLSDAIFFQTKGIPLSISWENQNETSVTLNVVAQNPWTDVSREKMRDGLEQRGFSILGIEEVDLKTLLVRAKVSSELMDDPLRVVEDLEKYLTPKVGPHQLYIGPAQETKAQAGWVLFPNVYTVYLLPLLLIGVYFLRGIFRFAQNFLVGTIGQKLVMRLRNDIYENLQNLSISYFERHSSGQSGQLIARITNDIDAIHFLFSAGIMDIVLEPMVVLLGLMWGFYMNWKLTLMFFLVFPFVAWPVNRLSKKLRVVNREVLDKVADITGVLEETLSAIKVVKAFGMEEYEIERFKRETHQSYKAAIRSLRLGNFFSPIIDFLITIAIAIFLTYGGSLIINNRLSPGEFLTFIFLMSFMGSPIRRISSLFSQLPKAMAAADRVFELIDQKSEVTEIENPVILPTVEGSVVFDHVTFGYEQDTPVLHDINLNVAPGEVIALVGPSGAGKTTMVNLVARFYDPISGRVLIDGHDLRELKLDELRRHMGIVPQETMLFRGTIAENIAYGRIGASREEIIEAAKAANAHEFIIKAPEGYETTVGARGMALSGGQRQRIAIARALLRDPKILILDEATSALDTQSEVLVQEALQRLMKGRTCFVIAHRLSTIRNANRIVVMDAGRIVEVGTHEELLKNNGLYAMLYRTQFKNQET